MTVHEYTVANARGMETPLDFYNGKVLLIVNTASRCGMTPQYAGLQALYERYHARGLEILAFPCDQFGHQEPGSNAEIQQFCQLNYGVTFPVFAKIEVNGPNAHPLYQFLTGQDLSCGTVPTGDIHWNFTKFLVDRDGKVLCRYESSVTPEQIEPEIEKLLGGAGS